MLSLKNMLYIVTTAKLCSFTKAAEALYVSQSAISQSIKSVEDELKTTLFIRHNNTIYLTKAGEIFVNEAEKLIERSELLKKRIMEISDSSKTIVKFGTSSFYSKFYLPLLIPNFEQEFADISFTFTEDISYNLENMVSNDFLDFCIVPLPLAHSDLSFELLREEKILLALPQNHPLCSAYPPDMPINLHDVKDEPFVFLKSFQRFTDLGLRLCRGSGFTPNIVYESSNWETIDALIGQGVGVGFVPDVVTNIQEYQKPVYRKIDSSLAHRSYALIFKKEIIQNKDYTKIIKCVKDTFATLPPIVC